ncbi:MAG: carbohydrate kinase [Gammaproteobacteria bacterium]|nr:carbohydrate kinase [Gammaproteobacteria bacterium]MDH5803026.1 carbohydrate kinase [Gammaproteobacteria bacterium]
MRPAVFGEVLFDCFEDAEVMGGAPFNVAWHLAGFGLNPLMLSAVGEDERGEQLLQAMQDWGMDTSGMQRSSYPTGQVRVDIVDGEPSYDIVTDQAYDHLQPQPIQKALAVADFGLLYHGSLAARSDSNRRLLADITAEKTASTFVDVNLRPPWWEFSQVRGMVNRARWLKLNLDEFVTLYFGDAPPADLADSLLLEDMARDIVNNSAMELLVITLGGRGALCASSEGCERGLPVPAESIVDTVGAGDSFSAVMIAGILRGWSMHDTLQRALNFASAICQNKGATSSNRELYEGFIQAWGI